MISCIKMGSFTWNTFLFPGHFSVQALSCSLLFHPSHFLCKGEINYWKVEGKLFIFSQCKRINFLPFKYIEVSCTKSHMNAFLSKYLVD